MKGWIIVGLALVAVTGLLVAPGTRAAPLASHYAPQAGDRFEYDEWINITDGTGDYSGYLEHDDYSGSIAMTAVAPNSTVSAEYSASGSWSSNEGGGGPWQESGSFTYSALSFHYVDGTDNQTGYVDPYVWFYMDNTLGTGSTFYLLNTEMTVESTNYAFPIPSSSTGYAAAIYAQGTGTYVRNDSYGIFTASYTWKSYFDPSTGYVLGYVITETDTNASGDGFTYTDTLTDSHTTFPLTALAVSSGTSSSSGLSFLWIAVIAIVAVVVLVILVVLLRRRSRATLPRHPETAVPGTLPTYGPPPSINLAPKDQPAIQQIVIKETVKVPCRYCGTLIDSTATNCPNCGAPRT